MTTTKLRDSIFECITEAQSSKSDQVTLQRALQTLVSITKVSPQNRNLVAQTQGALPTLVNLLQSESESSQLVQTLTLSVLFNLSLNPNLKQSLADTQTINRLNAFILSSASPADSSKIAASLICSLAMLDKNKGKFGVANTIQCLVKAISGPRTHHHHHHHLLSSLAELVQFHGNCSSAVRAGAVPVLIRLVEGTAAADGEYLAGTSLSILSLLARFDEGLIALKKTDNIVNIMLEVLRGRCMLSKEGAAEVLIRLFEESEWCVKDALKLEFSYVLADLSVRGSARARERADLLLKKMMEADLDDTYMEETPLYYHC